jgi:hypothetical protein
MGFSVSAYETMIHKLEAAPAQIISLTNKIISAVNGALGWIPFIGDAVKAGLNKLKGLVEQLVQKLQQVLKGAEVPVAMWNNGQQWLQIHAQTGGVASTIAGQIQASGNEWKGIAGGKYSTGVPQQAGAASALSSLAGSIQSSCTSVATTGFGFYAAIAAAVVSIIGGLIACAVAGWTGVGAIVGLCITIGGALIGIGSACALVTFGIDGAARNLQSLAAPTSSFPNGAWPIATAQ